MSGALVAKHLDYRSMRGLQISIVFTFTIFIQEFFNYPRAGWTGFAVMMIYAGFDNGTTLLRAYHRFLGVLLGLLSGYLLWFIGHIDYRTLIIIIPVTVFLAYFLVGHAYSVPTVFTVNTAIIGTGYFDTHNLFSITFFLVDYFICTIIAFTIIVLFEYFWFRRFHMMRRFINDTQAEVISGLNRLVLLLNSNKIKRGDWFRSCIKLTGSIFAVNSLINNAQFEISSVQAVGGEFNQFVELTNRIFIGLKALYLAQSTKRHHKFDYNKLFQQVQFDLAQLEKIVTDGQFSSITPGVLHEASH